MNLEWIEGPHDFLDNDPGDIHSYMVMMEDTYINILESKKVFIRDDYFSTSFKLERIEELIDFFLMEEEYDKCKKLYDIKKALEIKLILNKKMDI